MCDRQTRVQFLKFVGVGVLNTSISLGVIYICMRFGIDYKLSNLIGYLVGLVNSFIWNKCWVFGSRDKNVLKEILLFSFSFVICYGLQYMALIVMAEMLSWNQYLSQFFAMGIYTICNFILNRLITFRQ